MSARILFFILSLSVLSACTHDPFVNIKHEPQLNLKWNRGYSDELRSDIDTGLLWTLSFLGASLPEGSYDRAAQWRGDTLSLDITEVGFNELGFEALAALTDIIKATEEYQQNRCIDVGRFVSLVLLASPHYYKITDVPKTLEAFIAGKNFGPEVAIMKSTVSKSPRLISYSETTTDPLDLFFIAKEGWLDSANATMDIKEYEVMDIMPNGQLRFAIYDQFGTLLDAADTAYSFGGKPAKCLWCHETNINRNFALSGSHPEFLSVEDFNEQVDAFQSNLQQHRATLNTDLNYASPQAHTKAERLYISFMEPSASRLAREWNKTEDEVKALLISLPVHDHDEFSYMKNLYHRRDVEPFAPFKSLSVSKDAREGAGPEPNLIP